LKDLNIKILYIYLTRLFTQISGSRGLKCGTSKRVCLLTSKREGTQYLYILLQLFRKSAAVFRGLFSFLGSLANKLFNENSVCGTEARRWGMSWWSVAERILSFETFSSGGGRDSHVADGATWMPAQVLLLRDIVGSRGLPVFGMCAQLVFQ